MCCSELTVHPGSNGAASTALTRHRALHIFQDLGFMLAGLIAGHLLPQDCHFPLQLVGLVLCKAQVGLEAGLCAAQE